MFQLSTIGCKQDKYKILNALKSQLIWRCFSLKAIETYCNALINSNGGIVVFGVDHSGRGTIYDQNIKVYFMTTMNSAIIYSCRTSCRL